MKGDLCYCNNIYGLFSVLNINYDVSEWRLFIDARKYSIKAVLLRALKECAPKSGAPGARSYFEERSLERAPFENTGAEAGARSYF